MRPCHRVVASSLLRASLICASVFLMHASNLLLNSSLSLSLLPIISASVFVGREGHAWAGRGFVQLDFDRGVDGIAVVSPYSRVGYLGE